MKITAYDKIKSLILSMRFKTTPLGVICVYVGGLVAGAQYNSLNLFLAMLSTLFIGSSAQTINDYFDWNIDKINHPERPIPKGILKPNEMLYFSIILFLIGFIISIFINLLCVLIVVFSLIMLILYEKYLKNIGITGNITVGFISALSFTYGGAAVGNPFASILLSAIAFFLFTGRETLKDVQDVKGDVLSRSTLPMKIGEKNAAIVGSVFLIIALLITPLPYLLGQLRIGYLLFITIVDLICIYAIIETLKDLRNTERTVSLLRIASAIGIIAIIIGAVL